MAKSQNNVVVAGLSGRVGKQLVFSQRNGRTIVSKFPSHKKTLTPKQQAQQERFAKATVYSKNALQDPSLKESYLAEAKKRTGTSPYNMAVAGFLKAPVIDSVDTSAYTGASTGKKIIVTVTDTFKVTAVKVTIADGDTSAVEEGNATFEKGKWVYLTTAVNASLSGDKVTVTATDRPGNSTQKEVTL